MADPSKIELPIEQAVALEGMCKNLIDWLSEPAGAGWGAPPFSTAEQWREWGEQLRKRAYRDAYLGFHWLASARTGEGLPPDMEDALDGEYLAGEE